MTTGDEILVEITFRSASGKSIQSKPPGTPPNDLPQYQATQETRERAAIELQRLGFTVVGPVSPFGISVRGSRELVKLVFGTTELSVPPSLAPYVESIRIPPRGEFYVVS